MTMSSILAVFAVIMLNSSFILVKVDRKVELKSHVRFPGLSEYSHF